MFRNGNEKDFTLKYKRLEILKILQENLVKHKAEFEAAMVVFKARLIGDMERLVVKIRAGAFTEDGVKLKRPISFESSYARAIRMLDLSIEEDIELDGETFGKYVMDEWEWGSQFEVATKMYNSKE